MAEHKYLNIDGIRYLTSKYDLRYAKVSHSHKKSDITDFPTSMPASDVSAWAKASTKPTYTAAEVGLDKVDNTSDEDKPISRAVQAALDGKSGTHNHPYLPLSGGTLNDSATIKLSTYGTRFLTLTGNSISADMSKETGGWAGNFSSVKDPAGDTTALLGWYGNGAGLIHIYMGGTYNDPYMKMTKAGLFTFANLVTASGGLQSNVFKAPTSNGGSTYGMGTNGQVLKSNGSTLYWGTDENVTVDSALSSSSTNPVQNKVISAKITSLETADTNLDTSIRTLSDDLQSLSSLLSGYALIGSSNDASTVNSIFGAKAYADAKIAALVDSAPDTLNTLNELAVAINTNKDAVAAINSSITNKVDKVSGKGLSTNDFTTAYKNKLDGIASGATAVTESTVSGWGFTKNAGTVTSVKVGSTSYNQSSGIVSLPAYPSNYVPKTTYEWSKELACGSNGKVCLGKFGAYDTNITINITSTTSVTYNATIVIQSQNIAISSTAGTCKVDVYGDANNAITPLLSIFRPYGSESRQIEVYANLPGWSKNLVRVQAVALSTGGGTDILTSVDSIPTSISGKTKVTPTNVLKANFGTSNFSGNYNDLTNKPTLFSGNYNDLTNKPTVATKTANGLMSATDKSNLEVAITDITTLWDEVNNKADAHNHPYLPLSGGTIEGDLTLHATSGNSPKLIFQRGDATGTITDWNINVVSGALNFNTVSTSGSTAEKTIMTLGYSGGLDVVGNIKENGTLLSSKYLGLTAKAADSSKLNGQAPSYYLDYNNLNNKPNIPSGVAVDTSLSSTSSNAIANKTVKNAIDTIQTDVNTLFTSKSDEGHTHSYLPLAGGTITGTVTQTAGDMITNYCAVKSATHETGSYTKIVTLSNTGYIRYRTPAEMKTDLGVGQIKIGSTYYNATLNGTTLALTSS